MGVLAGKRIVMGVCGSIAAYKAVLILRGLQKEGAEVRVILTESATRFVQPLTFATLCRFPVYDNLWQTGDNYTAHVEMAEWANLLLIAPASAHSLAKFAGGLCDNLLTAVYLSARCPVMLAPAMDLEMYRHASVSRNLEALEADGCEIIEPESGFLSSGLEGKGRLAEPESIVARVRDHFHHNGDRNEGELTSLRVLVTAGPTREAIDPVRYLSNHSTSKMGIALAEEARNAGAEVCLLLGPTNEEPPVGIEVHRFESAASLEALMQQHWPAADVLIMAAAVADYTPAEPAEHKIKKKEQILQLKLKKTTDLLAEASKNRKEGQRVVGFALETEHGEKNALEKLEKKKLDLIVLNIQSESGSGFGHDTNLVSTYDRHNNRQDFPLMTKKQLAHQLIPIIAKLCRNPYA